MTTSNKGTPQTQNKRGRPRLPARARRVQITLSLRWGKDDDLLAFFDRLPEGQRAQAVMDALRGSGSRYPGNDMDDVFSL